MPNAVRLRGCDCDCDCDGDKATDATSCASENLDFQKASLKEMFLFFDDLAVFAQLLQRQLISFSYRSTVDLSIN